MPAGNKSAVRPPQPAALLQLLAFLAMGLLVACVYRLIWLEKHRAPALRRQAAGQQRSKTTYPARRGAIVDSNPVNPRQHTTLAASYLLDTAGIDPKWVRQRDRPVLLDALTRVLKLGASRQAELTNRLIEAQAEAERTAAAVASGAGAPGGKRPVRFIPVKRFITPAESAAIRELKRDRRFRGISLTLELKREYPAGRLAAHVIGFVNAYGSGKEGEGLERRFDDRLAGADGSKRVIADALRRPIWSHERDYVRPRDGLSLVLNINVVIQSYAEQALAETVRQYQAESGVAVVMDPRTGAVLALANEPTFEPAGFRLATADQRRDRALTDPYEPGSIFKWAVLAGAIENRVVRPADVFECHHGQWDYNGRLIHDAHGYGKLTVRQILVKSSNIGMSKIGLALGRPRLYRCLSDFGFGAKTGIELNDVESAGLLRPLEQWTGYSVPSLSFGQEIMVTSIQLAAAFSALANGVMDSEFLFSDAVLSTEVKGRDVVNGKLVNGGYLLRPRLVQALVDDSQVPLGGSARVVEDYSRPILRRRVVSPATARTMVDILTKAVASGTGRRARIQGVNVFGKTGTAQIQQGGRYVDGLWTSSFIGGAPAEAPRVVALMSIRKPEPSLGYYGGTVAAPAVRQMLARTLAFLQAER